MHKTILVVGASGLLGHTFCELFNQEYTLYNCGRSRIDETIQFIDMDLSQPLDETKLPNKVDVILYLAQSYKFREFPKESNDIYQINTVRILDFLNYAKKYDVKQFIYASTGGVYTSNEIHTEDEIIDATKLNGFYPVSKYSAELLVNSYKNFFNVAIIRPFFIFGERQNKDMLIPRLILNVKNKKPIQLQGKDGLKLNPIYVQDAAKILDIVIEKKLQGIYNMAGNRVISLKEVCEIIGEKININPIFEYNDSKPMDIIADTKKMGYDDYILFETALERTINGI